MDDSALIQIHSQNPLIKRYTNPNSPIRYHCWRGVAIYHKVSLFGGAFYLALIPRANSSWNNFEHCDDLRIHRWMREGHPKPLRCSFCGERGNYWIWTYLSFIQHKTLEVLCNPDVVFFLVDSTLGLISKTSNESTRGHLNWINNKPIGGQVFMLDEWKVCTYMIISPLPLTMVYLISQAKSQAKFSDKVHVPLLIGGHLEV